MAEIFVREETLPRAWEEAVIRCWKEGDQVRTEYDKPDDPESRDCTILIVAEKPFQEPRIHRAFPGGLEDLEVYRQEVALGIHDHWIDPAHGKWSYTYHQRMFAYDVTGEDGRRKEINQFEFIINKLAEAPHSRRAQAITWKPDVDPTVEDPACLQRMWFRIFNDELRLNVHMRSNDAFKAAFMNMWAFTDLQRYVAEEVSKRLGRELKLGAYCHIVDSFHIYGSYFNDFKGFLETLEKRSFKDRVWDSTSDLVQSSFDYARERIRQEKEKEAEENRRGL
ncbi:MAG: thymidylate synthase [Planctomycetota bacterium]